ncbi:acetylglutamate kinase [Aquimarina sp. U1-2]|uniref:acetylglutamate kinase n=1 Tax=Aquimarina sp. U1-2 TaxID=2823141 RepID=UPI001AECCEB5|nr:acetylglutamate kinase [Aquimarina sp. U1-2]MBP2833650.1 acetylglutamate kinase [Aquimarina sp. U1-2]
MKRQQLLVAKIGGNTIENPDALYSFLSDFAKIKRPKILVHGGGRTATTLASRLGITTEMIDGRRITSSENLEIIVQTYAGLINKRIVACLQKNDCNALGLTGADANVMLAKKRPVQFVDYGFVGDVSSVNSNIIKGLIDLDIVPVFCAVTHDGDGQLLNTNADTIASEIAAAMSSYYKVSLYYCFEFQGVLHTIKDQDSVIEHINRETYHMLLENNVIADGMLPKLQNCFDALHKKVHEVHIANANYLKDPTTKHTTLTL